jgi:GDP-D-mannose 3',5'-epimerase
MPEYKARVCIGGGAGFIGSHLGKKLKAEGYYVIAADWKKNEFMKNSEFCNEFRQLDLRDIDNCVQATKACEHVYNLAADMGGMGFIQSNQSVLFYNNTMISSNMIEAARRNGAKRFFYASSACVYNEALQLDPNNPGLTESMAWPAEPQDTYGLEKLYAEEMVLTYGKDFGIESRIARFHNIYGPHGTWKGGREKSPAAFVRKSICSTKDFEMWGDGKQTRSYTFVDDCVEGIVRLMFSDCKVPINLGTEEMVTMNDFAKLCLKIEGRDVPIRHVAGPEGVRGRNSDNKLIREQLGWEPSIKLADGIARTHAWIKQQVAIDKAAGIDISQYAVSTVVKQSTDDMEVHKNSSNLLALAAGAAALAGAAAFLFNKKK